MDGVLCDIAAAYQAAARTHPDVAFPQSIPGLFASLDAIPGAIEAVAALRRDPRLDVWILSAPSTRNPACYSEKRIWVEKVFDYPLAKRLILASDKSLLRGDILIDDNISGKGQERFEGELIHFGSARYPTWSSVLEYLHQRVELVAARTGHPAPGAAVGPPSTEDFAVLLRELGMMHPVEIAELMNQAGGAGCFVLQTAALEPRLVRGRWEDIQEARPEPLTEEEYAAMLLGKAVHSSRSGKAIDKGMYPGWRVSSVVVLPDYCLRVVFNDGITGIVRMKRLIHSDGAGVFAALRDPARFTEVRVELGAVTWSGGIDLAPDAMYDAIAASGEWVP